VEDLLETLVEARRGVGQGIDEIGHFGLPAGVGRALCERSPEGAEIVDLEVGEQVAPVNVDRVVAASGSFERSEHLRPDRRMTPPVLGLAAGQDAHDEANSFHHPPRHG
jgi:hypothetical protein